MSSGEERDAHLLAALKHAPDLELQAPAALTAQILARARQTVAPAPKPAAWQRWWLGFSAPTRWGASGAFATLVLAGFVTLLWHEETPGPATEGWSAAPVPAAVELAASRPPSPAAQVLAEVTAKPPAVAAPPQRAAKESAKVLAPASPATSSSPPPAPERRREPAPLAQGTAAESALSKTQTSDAAPAPLPAPTPALAPAAPPMPAPALERAPQAAAADAAAPMSARLSNRMSAAPPWGLSPAATDSFLWQPAGTAVDARPLLAELVQRTAGVWRTAPQTQPAPDTPVLLWQQEGNPRGHLWFERRDSAWWVWWCNAQTGSCQQAPLAGDPPAAARLPAQR
jgi:hypothetical protein